MGDDEDASLLDIIMTMMFLAIWPSLYIMAIFG
jgi:hypothetical protein